MTGFNNGDHGVAPLDHYVPDIDLFLENQELIRKVTDAALRECGGRIEKESGRFVAFSPYGQSQRAFRLGLEAARVPYESVTAEDYRAWLHDVFLPTTGKGVTDVVTI